MSIENNPLVEKLATPEDLQGLVRSVMNWAKECLRDGERESWTPSLFALVEYPPSVGKERGIELFSLMLPFNTDQEKRLAMMQMGASFASDNFRLPVAIAFTSEIWVSVNPPAGMRPADDPFRQEAIIAMGRTLQGDVCQAPMPFQRINGRIVVSEFVPVVTEGLSLPLLDHFYKGYAMAVQQRNRVASPRQAAPSAN